LSSGQHVASAATVHRTLQAIVRFNLLDWPFRSSRPTSCKFNYCARMK
jgi:hypothetical protein